MNTDLLSFFDRHMNALPLYEALEHKITEEIENVRIKVQKSQISFYSRHLFACVSFARVRKKKDCPAVWIVLTLGLDHRLDSPRIEVATEPYPGRWTHHLLISDPNEVDEELLSCIKEAAAFSDRK